MFHVRDNVEIITNMECLWQRHMNCDEDVMSGIIRRGEIAMIVNVHGLEVLVLTSLCSYGWISKKFLIKI